MKLSRRTLIISVLLLFCLIIHLYAGNELRVETSYSKSFFPPFASFLRRLSGMIPFSIGDILYGSLVAWLIWTVGKFIFCLLKKTSGTTGKSIIVNALYKSTVFCCSIYIIFNLFWGINYDRKGIAWQLGLNIREYSAADLKEINSLLIDKINNAKLRQMSEVPVYPSSRQLFDSVAAAYKNVSGLYQFLEYKPSAIKSSIWGWLGNYTGFTGYYNPFTGEAQLNSTIPRFLHPFVACHEVAHQLGYAKENEANFVGYLAASNSGNALFQYSVYLDLFTYANRNFYMVDSTAAIEQRKRLLPPVIADIKEWMTFNRRHQSFVEPVIRWIYGKYLQGNRQPAGILSYDEVTGFIISYYKKFGRI